MTSTQRPGRESILLRWHKADVLAEYDSHLKSSEACGAVLRSEHYCDLAPAQVWAQLLDDGIYLCSIRTMYRLLAITGENR